jgi:ribosomal protein S18 acetylase RimI-like enzyme
MESDGLYQVMIRQVTQADLAGLEWEGEYTHYRQIYIETFKRVERGLALIWVLELPEQKIIGQALVQLVSDRKELADGATRAYIFAFRIRPAYRNRGLGSRLLKIIEDDLITRGYIRATLNVAKDNPRALALYEHHGYVVVAEESGNWSYPDEKGVWHQVREPAWRMEKKF